MIKKIIPCSTHKRRIKTKIDEIIFDPGYNVLIGPNQSGKSTLLESLVKCDFCEVEKDPKTKINFLSTEDLNPLGKNRFSSYYEMIMHTRALFSSHGEIVREVLGNQKYLGEDCFIIDTPETGQDIEQCNFIYEGLRKMIKEYNIQVIIATHHPVFLKDSDRIIELEKDYSKKLIELYDKSLKDFNLSK